MAPGKKISTAEAAPRVRQRPVVRQWPNGSALYANGTAGTSRVPFSAPETHEGFLGRLVREQANKYHSWLWTGKDYRDLGEFDSMLSGMSAITAEHKNVTRKG